MHLDDSHTDEDSHSVMSLPDSPVELGEMEMEQADDPVHPTAGRASPPEPVPTEQTSLTVSKLLKGKDKEWDEVAHRKGPLTLLELPIDILRLIVKEITHTNDLTSLALTNSTLHSLAIPHIYARFDIVWPDASISTSDAKSVDALTYGLSTLSLGSSFSRIRQRLFRRRGMQGGRPPLSDKGNNYAVHTRKFSLGNGPQDWVAEYMITKESGKMLGTLVAMALAKMGNLETFVWDMPTGVLAEIFLALASLPDHHADGECNLDRVWVRWHDNSENSAPASSSTTSSPVTPQQAQVPVGSTLTPVGIMLPSNTAHPKPRPAIPYASSAVEYPTFSVLPPLRSLTVLDIDELAYLDEMAMLIERSQDRLQELRVGISQRAAFKDFVQTWDGQDLHQVDHDADWPGASTIGERRLGGVLGTIVGRIYDIRRKVGHRPQDKGKASPGPAGRLSVDVASPGVTATVSDGPAGTAAAAQTSLNGPDSSDNVGQNPQPVEEPQTAQLTNGSKNSTEPPPPQTEDQGRHQNDGLGQGQQLATGSSGPGSSTLGPDAPGEEQRQRDQSTAREDSGGGNDTEAIAPAETGGRKRLEGKLKLHTLELERIPLSIQVCSKAIDWTTLTNLTILECAQQEALWKLLRRQFQPTPMSAGLGIATSSSRRPSTEATTPTAGSSSVQLQYHLSLKRIHTDTTSAPLISFIKETLAPNTLEVLFLQDRRKNPGAPPVTIDAIFRGAVKRHRLSLRKLLLDSSTKNTQPSGNPSPTESTRWRHWVLTPEILLYITSGRMRNLRELAVSLAYADWHTFLQRLPNVPQLRSLNIPQIADHLVGSFEPKELALQIADIITLRPEIQLCYVGISTKCFEILESTPGDRGSSGSNGGSTSGLGHGSSLGGENSSNGNAGLGTGGANGTHGIHANGVVVINTSSDNDSAVEAESDDGHQSDTSEEADDTEDEDGLGIPSSSADPDETQSEGHSDAGPDDDDDDFVDPDLAPAKTKLRLREILFYDDKVAIFKARHGRL